MLVHSDDPGGSEGSLVSLVVARRRVEFATEASPAIKNLELGIELSALTTPEQHGRLAVGAHDVNADGGHLSQRFRWALGARLKRGRRRVSDLRGHVAGMGLLGDNDLAVPCSSRSWAHVVRELGSLTTRAHGTGRRATLLLVERRVRGSTACRLGNCHLNFSCLHPGALRETRGNLIKNHA